jgi:antitoxin VapB
VACCHEPQGIQLRDGSQVLLVQLRPVVDVTLKELFIWHTLDDIYLDRYRSRLSFYFGFGIRETAMKAKIFKSGRSQAVRQPREFRFDSEEVFVRRDTTTGDVVLSKRPDSWDELFLLDMLATLPADFMSEEERKQGSTRPDPFTS